MSDSLAVRFLADSTDDRALAQQKLFDSKLRAMFDPKTEFYDRSQNIAQYKDLSGSRAKSHQFMQLADIEEAINYRPGVEMLGRVFGADDESIAIDDWIVDHHDIPIDQMEYVDWNILTPLMNKMAAKVRTQLDKKLAITGVKAARTAAKTKTVSGEVLTIHNGGNVVERTAATIAAAYPTTATGAKTFIGDLAHLGQLLREDNVPEEGWYLFIGHYIRRVLSNEPTIFSAEFDRSGLNDFASKVIGKVENFHIVHTNHLPSTAVGDLDLGGTTTYPLADKYQGSFIESGDGAPAALALCGASMGDAAMGVVTNGGLKTAMVYDPRRMTTFIFCGIQFGAGVLNPICAGEVRVDAA